MKKSARCLGIFAIIFYSAASHAELIYSPNTVLDTATGTTWRAYSTVEAGLSNGFKPATVDQTAALFLDYAPLNSGGKLPGYNPEVGGIKSMTTSEDGTSFSVSYDSSYLYEGSSPPSLLKAFGHNVEFGGSGPGVEGVLSLVGLVQDGNSWTSVLLRHSGAADQYGKTWGTIVGVIDPPDELFLGIKEYVVCSGGCTHFDGNPYLDSSGAVKLGGYLMVSSVPELPPAISLFAGLLLLSLFIKPKILKNT
ncbi:MAG TPA: hypothetical protein VIZ65_04170 [Cellvibrionaceae bacterium]